MEEEHEADVGEYLMGKPGMVYGIVVFSKFKGVNVAPGVPVFYPTYEEAREAAEYNLKKQEGEDHRSVIIIECPVVWQEYAN